MQRRTYLAFCLILCGGVACGGPSFRGNEYRDEETRYHVGTLGPTWQRLSVKGGNDLAFGDDRKGAIIQVNASCDPSLDIPLEALTQQLLIGFTERQVRSEERRPVDGREALRTHLVAKLDGVPRELLFYVIKKDGCVYDFALVSPPGESFQGAQPEYESFVSAFRAHRSSP